MKVVILRGISGSGKSSIAQKLIEGEPNHIICSADEYFMKEDPETGEVTYDFDPSKLSRAHASCMDKFLRGLMEKVPLIIVDNTNTERWEYGNYILAAHLADYDIEVQEIEITTIEQLKQCVERNVHGTPGTVVATQVLRWQNDNFAHLQEMAMD